MEHDFLGEKEISNDCYYGVQTLRAKENFDITGIPLSSQPVFIKAFAFVKKCAALANRDCGILSEERTNAICFAADKLIAGGYTNQFVSDLIQGGAGTSCNMNVNEVIANIGLEHMGFAKGQYEHLHPNNHVNCSQSTNDAYPTAFRLALYLKIKDFTKALEALRQSFFNKGQEFDGVLKMGRTQLQDAVPMTLGQEFNAFATTIGEDILRLHEAQKLLLEINMGATAIGTGVNAPEGYAEKCVAYMNDLSGIPVVLAHDLIEATYDTGAYVQLSGTMKRSAVKLSKICNDLRLLQWSTLWIQRNQPAAHATGFFHYARQGEPRYSGSHEPNLLLCNWRRPDRNHGSRGRTVATECNGTRNWFCPVYFA